MRGLCSNCGQEKRLTYDELGEEWICEECWQGEDYFENYPDENPDSAKWPGYPTGLPDSPSAGNPGLN